VAAALTLIPFFLAERLTDNAIRDARVGREVEFSQLELAADLNPWSDRALATEADIARNQGDTERALNALSEAQRRQPTDWTLYFIEAQVLAETDPAGALGALEKARALNPDGEEIAELTEEIEAGSADGPGG
jgi:tetratricopeptide (TPR) repeat protein